MKQAKVRQYCIAGLLAIPAIGICLAPAGAEPAVSDAERIAYFQTQVLPILQASCFKCHGDGEKIKGGLRLSSRRGILDGGDTGPAVSLDRPDKSLMLK